MGAKAPLKIVILGGIAPHKGSKVLLDCAKDALARNLPLHFTLLGHSDLEKQLAPLKNVTLSGRYLPHKLTGLLKAGKFHLAFLPSVIPETYNYTLSECWQHGLFPVCLDIGAIAARIRATGQGCVLPYEFYYQPERLNDALLSLAIQPIDKEKIIPALQEYPSLLQNYYGFPPGSA